MLIRSTHFSCIPLQRSAPQSTATKTTPSSQPCEPATVKSDTRALTDRKRQVSAAAGASIGWVGQRARGADAAGGMMSTVLRSRSNDRERAQTLRKVAGSSSRRRQSSRACGVLACLLLTGPARAGPASRRGIMTGFVGRGPAATTSSAGHHPPTELGSTDSLRRADGWNRKRSARRQGVASMAVTTSAAGLQAETVAQQSR